MLTIETKELVISEELKKKVDMICKFACVNNYSFENSDYVFINDHKDKIKFTNLCDYIKEN